MKLSEQIKSLVRDKVNRELNAHITETSTHYEVRFRFINKGLKRQRIMMELEKHYGEVDSVETYKYTKGDYDWVFTFEKVNANKKHLVIETCDNKVLSIHNVIKSNQKSLLIKLAKENGVKFDSNDIKNGIVTDGSYTVQTWILNID